MPAIDRAIECLRPHGTSESSLYFDAQAELHSLRTLAAQAEANAKKWLEVVRITNNRGYTPTEIGWELRKLIREYGELIE